jgi:hypothetical protein
MYRLIDLTQFALSEFERGLAGLSDEDARARLKKADGTEMNAISWTVGHIAGHWASQAAGAFCSGLERFDAAATGGSARFVTGGADVLRRLGAEVG